MRLPPLLPMVVLGCAAVGLSMCVISRQSSEVMSARQGGAWLTAYTQSYKDPGVPWVIYTLDAKYCASDVLAAFAKERFTREFGAKPLEHAYAPLVGLSADTPEQSLMLSSGSTVFDDIIMPALYCNEIPIASSTERIILSVESARGYTLTHKFLALLFMRERGCLLPAGEQALQTAAENIRAEQLEASFDDLYAERVAFLLYGGFNSFVQDSWITTIIANQQPSGGWKAVHRTDFFGISENPHTTALAIFALALHAHVCPFTIKEPNTSLGSFMSKG